MDQERSYTKIPNKVHELLRINNKRLDELYISISPDILTKKFFNNCIRYGHKITKKIEIKGFGNLDRRMLWKIIVAFAHCKKIILTSLYNIDFTGDFAINENCKIYVQTISLRTYSYKDVFTGQVDQVFSSSKIVYDLFFRQYECSGANFLNSQANQNVKISLMWMNQGWC